MIAAVSNGRRFAGLARYLTLTRGGEPTRAAWIVGRNLPVDDALLAAKVMQATAAANARVRDPVYHVALAFDPADPVTRGGTERVADRVLRDVGLAGHQVLLVAHEDRAHPHVHLMVNRVHPETGRAWDRAHDYRRLEASLRAVEQELGLRLVPGRHAPALDVAVQVPARDDGRLHRHADQALALASAAGRNDGLDARTHGERRREMRTAEVALIAQAAALRHVFAASTAWDDLTRALEAAGVHLERRGQGLVVTDGRTAVKASRVARECATARLEARFGEAYDTWAARRAPSTERTSIAGRGARRRPAATEHPMATTVTPVPDELAERAARRGPVQAAELADAVRAADYASRQLVDPHRANPELARPIAEQSVGARHVVARMAQYESVLQAGMEAARARETVAVARDAVSDGVHLTRVAQGAEREVVSAVEKAYQDPAKVRREVDTAVQQIGYEKTAELLRKTPEVFGALRVADAEMRKAWGVDEKHADRPARAEASHAALLLDRGERTRAEAPTPEQMTRLMQAADRAEVAAVTAEATLARSPSGDALARSIARGVARLDDRAFGELKAALPVARAELAETFREGAVQALARESAGRVQHLREQVGERLGASAGGGAAQTGAQLESAAALHERAARSLNDGRELARVLGPRGAAELPGTAGPERGVAREGAPAGRDAATVGGDRGGAGQGGVATPRERVAAADVVARAVHQAVQALTPEELQGLVAAVRAGVEIVKAIGRAGPAAPAIAAHQAVRAGVARMLTGPEVER
ncbi:hypothetical protein tb265_48610 [Gemmatimonadetes bacterium T265]|nr:hypothetical protein tb265_48610 [Gemmatimonadetes bacterium T265]